MNTNQLGSMFSTRLSSAYNQLRGDLGAPQTATETIEKLVDRIQTSAAVEDRRTAVLGLKGLSRDWKEDVGHNALPSLIAVLEHDAPFDVEIAKATLETLMQLCETAEKPAKDDLGLFFTDAFLEDPKPAHTLINLISSSSSFYPRFFSIQFLSQLLASRSQVAQSYIMSAPPPGIDGILAVLDTSTGPTMAGGASEMLRNEALLLFPAMLSGNQDLQKIVAFSGAFEKLFQIIDSEGGVDGGIVVQDALAAVGYLLRFNVSNQNYFRELTLIPQIPHILGFPSPLAKDEATPEEFALQYWPEQKVDNTSLVLGLVRMLVGGPGGGNQNAMAASGVTRCLLELSLASNAPASIKSQCLSTLTPILTSSPINQDLFASLQVSHLLAVPADEVNPNGGFVRVPPKPAVVALVESVVEGDPSSGGRSLRSRSAGVNMFQAYLSGNDDARIGLLSSLLDPTADGQSQDQPSASSLILTGLLELPHASLSPDFDPYPPLFSCLLLSHLIRNSEHAKKLARDVTFPSGDSDSAVDTDDDKVSLIQLVVGNLLLASREQTECVNKAAKEGASDGLKEEEEWTRVIVGYLMLLCTWLWDSPKSVKEFLSESNNLQALIQPITQNTSIDPLIQGLSAFLLGVCYEFNREPGEITRATLHPILHSRIGPDQFVSRMARLREDVRFRAVQPLDFELDEQVAQQQSHQGEEEADEDVEVWFDWAFVDFWKNHYYTIQRSIAIDPDAVRGSNTPDDTETTAIILSLRSKLKTQTDEVASLTSKLDSIHAEHKTSQDALTQQTFELGEQVKTLTAQLEESKALVEALESELAGLREAFAKSEETAAGAETTSKELGNVKEEFEKVKADYEKASSELQLARMSAKGRETKMKDLEGKVKKLEEEVAVAKASPAPATAPSDPAADTGKQAEAEEALKKKEEEIAKREEEWKLKEAEYQEKLKQEEVRVKELEESAKASAEKTTAGEDKTATLESKIKELEEKLAAAPAAAAAAEPAQGGSNKQAKKRAAELDGKVKELETSLAEEKTRREEEAKEHEDLLVLLDELTGKRMRDKEVMKEKGIEVSEDEEEGDDEE
ncbi:hypothetical protein L198_00144 [Cryptococcus wingfieldii CBS 7118]|uniref:Uncharacterized protein n=1 Tax=Cryptococcus wingfieldii CBS 7118 TaxID=1295528 RepID=A0A1E3K5D1_9TREE|nr:hypothetical protein L198_00144 [Cryptococcus wingfieldii CBS 7118]ODO08414.1 hypothetical protein L198_00144 [Cryptococcus wingfieldii CBS 7118]